MKPILGKERLNILVDKVKKDKRCRVGELCELVGTSTRNSGNIVELISNEIPIYTEKQGKYLFVILMDKSETLERAKCFDVLLKYYGPGMLTDRIKIWSKEERKAREEARIAMTHKWPHTHIHEWVVLECLR